MGIATLTGRKGLFKIAEDLGEMKSSFVTTSGTTTSVTCANLVADANTYQYSIGRILGKGDCIISSQTAAGVFTVATLDSAPATNDVFQWSWWTGNKMGDAIAAMNEAIRYAWPFWYREKQTGRALTGTVAKNGTTTITGTSTLFLSELSVGDYISVPGTAVEVGQIATIVSDTSLTLVSAFAQTASAQTATIVSNLTLAAGTYEYTLPPACDALLAIGIQPASSPIEWFEWGDESSPYWQVNGQRGAYRLRFNPHFSRDGAIPDVYDTGTLILWYATREPELTVLTTSSCQLPIDYFAVAAQIYAVRNLQTASRVDLVTANVAIPQLQDSAKLVLQSLGIGKRPPNRILNPDAQIPDYKLIAQQQELEDKAIRRKLYQQGKNGLQ